MTERAETPTPLEYTGGLAMESVQQVIDRIGEHNNEFIHGLLYRKVSSGPESDSEKAARLSKASEAYMKAVGLIEALDILAPLTSGGSWEVHVPRVMIKLAPEGRERIAG